MAVHDPQLGDDRQVVGVRGGAFGREAGDQIGPHGKLGSASAQGCNQPHRIAAQVTPLHPLEDQIVAMLQRQMDMRHDPRLARDQFEQQRVDLDPVKRRQPQPVERGEFGQDSGHHRAERRRTWQIMPPAGQIDPGQHGLAGAAFEMARDLVQDCRDRQRAAGPAPLRDDAKGAGVIAAVLNRDKPAAVHAGQHSWRWRHIPGARIELCGVGDQPIDFRHCG